jgi:hypothetical protein
MRAPSRSRLPRRWSRVQKTRTVSWLLPEALDCPPSWSSHQAADLTVIWITHSNTTQSTRCGRADSRGERTSPRCPACRCHRGPASSWNARCSGDRSPAPSPIQGCSHPAPAGCFDGAGGQSRPLETSAGRRRDDLGTCRDIRAGGQRIRCVIRCRISRFGLAGSTRGVRSARSRAGRSGSPAVRRGWMIRKA